MDLIGEILLIVIIPIAFSWVYAKLMSGFISDVFVTRITKATFELSVVHISELWSGYFIGMLVITYIAHQFVKYVPGIELTSNLRVIILLLGLSILFIGRTITRTKGIFYGKLHFASLSIIGSFFFVLNSVIMMREVVDGDGLYYLICSHMNAFLIRIQETVIFLKPGIAPAIFGTFILAVLGEAILAYTTNSYPRSLITSSEKFPPSFLVITGKNGIKNKVDEMLGEDLISLRCVTKSCKMVELIRPRICKQYGNNKDGWNKHNYRILNAPHDRVIEDYDHYYDHLRFNNPMRWIVDFEDKIKEHKEKYEERKKILDNLITHSIVEAKDYYFGELRLLIVETGGDDKELLFSVRDTGPSKKRVGLYTKEPYLVESFTALFDTIWQV